MAEAEVYCQIDEARCRVEGLTSGGGAVVLFWECMRLFTFGKGLTDG